LTVIGHVPNVGAVIEQVAAAVAPYRDRGHVFSHFLERVGLLTAEARHSPLVVQADVSSEWGRLAQEGLIAEDVLYEALAGFINRPMLDAPKAQALLDVDLARRFPRRVSESLGVLPLRCSGHKLLFAATTPASESVLISSARDLANAEPHRTVVAASTLEMLQHTTYGAKLETPELERPLSLPSGRAANHVIQSLRAMISSPPLEPTERDGPDVPEILEALLDRALEQRASDIHIERYEGRVEVRFRVDGSLLAIPDTRVDTQTVRSLTTKIKVDARLDIAERRRPQDGVMRRRSGGRVVDFRVAVQPSLWGENVVLRILDQSKAPPGLEQLGLSAGPLTAIRRIVSSPQGLILLTGPTGSGKTTTLYAILRDLKQHGLKIVTAEDPVEYAIDGVQQSQIDEAIGNTFDHYLRAFLRQDPDVILVGEIRDPATAEMAVRAAMTGHLVLSTLHVNDALSSVKRMLGLGVDPGLLAATLSCVLSQRLLRCVCTECCTEEVQEGVLREMFPAGVPGHARVRGARGCATCHFVGYLGRTAVAELWVPSDGIRAMLERGAQAAQLEQRALADGLEPLAVGARRLVESGVTTIDEVVANVPYDQLERYVRGVA
jgi:type IV pilus assembly protein PilB